MLCRVKLSIFEYVAMNNNDQGFVAIQWSQQYTISMEVLLLFEMDNYLFGMFVVVIDNSCQTLKSHWSYIILHILFWTRTYIVATPIAKHVLLRYIQTSINVYFYLGHVLIPRCQIFVSRNPPSSICCVKNSTHDNGNTNI